MIIIIVQQSNGHYGTMSDEVRTDAYGKYTSKTYYNTYIHTYIDIYISYIPYSGKFHKVIRFRIFSNLIQFVKVYSPCLSFCIVVRRN